MKSSKGFLAAFLAFLVVVSLLTPAFAAPAVVNSDAQLLADLGLFNGTGSGLTQEYLTQVATRYQAAILILRLKALESFAVNYDSKDNFADANLVSDINQKVLAYIKVHPEFGLTGKGDNKFDPLAEISVTEFYKLMLEQLGYKCGTDFQYANTNGFAADKGIYVVASSDKLTNANLATILVATLKAEVKGTGKNLISSLVQDKAVSADKLIGSGLIVAPAYKVISYLPAWKDWGTVDVSKLTHINLAFAVVDSDGKIADGKDIKASHFEALRLLKEKNPFLKTIISVGGYAAEGFSDAALTEASRNTFADSVVAYLRQNTLDGVDIDWEYPVNGGWGVIKSRPEDKQNFTLLMQALRDKLDAAGAVDGKHYLLSFAGAASPSYLDWTEPAKLAAIVDFVNLMEYDFHGTWENTTGLHSNLYKTDSEPNGLCAADVVNNYINAGFPAEKINMGTAFYGHLWAGVKPENNGLMEPATGAKADVTYNDILEKYSAKQGYIRYWDSKADAAYLFNGDTFITYDDPVALKYEMNFVKDNKLGGAMIWEYTQDTSGVLLSSIYYTLLR